MAEEKKIDETVPGGKYILGDNYVDSDGKVLGKVKGSDAAANKDSDTADSKDADKDPKK